MKSTVVQLICRLLIVSMTLLSLQSAHAGMIGTNQVISAGSGQVDRDAVLRVMSRSEVSSQLQSMGIDAQTAKERVAAMTDEEIHAIANKLDTLPAGGSGDWGWGLAAVVVIAAIIYFVYGWKK